jgi:hypothetical protein
MPTTDSLQAEPMSASAHGEISNPPSPLGGQVRLESSHRTKRRFSVSFFKCLRQVVEDSDARAADSPQAGPSGYFSRPDPVSNPSSPQAGPSAGPAKRRSVHPDSFASNKRGKFDPTPGPSGLCNLRSSLTVSRYNKKPFSPFLYFGL